MSIVAQKYPHTFDINFISIGGATTFEPKRMLLLYDIVHNDPDLFGSVMGESFYPYVD